jgi:hypothetical protein
MGNISISFLLATSERMLKKNTTKEPLGGSKLERLAIAIAKSQLARHSYHITFVD